MKALIHTGLVEPWADLLGDPPSMLHPAGNRPLLEYWLEYCVQLGISDVTLVLGEGAYRVEQRMGSGTRWGVDIHYVFMKPDANPLAILRRNPARWQDGLLFVGGSFFPMRDAAVKPGSWPEDQTFLLPTDHEHVLFISRNASDIDAFMHGRPIGGTAADALGFQPVHIDCINDYFQINMQLVRGAIRHYVEPGYLNRDEAYIGTNVVIPPSTELNAPLIIGDDCRMTPLTRIGPHAIIGSHVVVDTQTELRDCMVMDGTYVGRNLEVSGKIVTSRRIIVPETGAALDIHDPWVISEMEGGLRFGDVVRMLLGWIMALITLTVMIIPFAVLYPLLTRSDRGYMSQHTCYGRGGRPLMVSVWCSVQKCWMNSLFLALSLNLVPRLWLVLRGSLWLCGHRPCRNPEENSEFLLLKPYFPAAISYDDRKPFVDVASRRVSNLYFTRYRSVLEMLKIFFGALFLK